MEAMKSFAAIFARPGRPAKSLKQINNDSSLAKARSLPRNPSKKPRKDESKTFILTPRGSTHEGHATNKSGNGLARPTKANDGKKRTKPSELKKLSKKNSKMLKKQNEASNKRDATAARDMSQEPKNPVLLFNKKLDAKRKTSDCRLQLPVQSRQLKKPPKQQTKNKSLLEADLPTGSSQRDNRLFKMLASSLREGSLLCSEAVLDKPPTLFPSKRLRLHPEPAKPPKRDPHSAKLAGPRHSRSRSKEAARDASPAVDPQTRFFTRRTTNLKRSRQPRGDLEVKALTPHSTSASKLRDRCSSPDPQHLEPVKEKATRFSPHLRSKWRRLVPESTEKKQPEENRNSSRRTLGEATVQRFASLRSKEAALHRHRMETTDTCSKEKRQQSSHLLATCRHLHKLRLKTSPGGLPRPVLHHMKSLQAFSRGGSLLQTLKKAVDLERGGRADDYDQALFQSTLKLDADPQSPGLSDSPDRPSIPQPAAVGPAGLLEWPKMGSPADASPADARLAFSAGSRVSSSCKSRKKENMAEVFEQFPTVPQEALHPTPTGLSLKARTLPVIVVRQSSNIYSLPVSKI